MSLLLISTNPSTINNASLSRRANSPSLRNSGRRPSHISCKQQPSPETDLDSGKNVIDRRNVLIGLSGVYGATATLGSVAFGAPVQPPELRKCHKATDSQMPDGEDTQVDCCPPTYDTRTIKDFQRPEFTQLRVRPPAHRVDRSYIAKFEEAVRRMKALPADDPWNFYQQAQLHCAFCNGAYDQFAFEGIPLQVHYGYLFAPWHRYYLYFWEKILGKLIDDPSFAVPYWNWDNPSGMYMPRMYYSDKDSPLYNEKRNLEHYNALLNYKYKTGDPNPRREEKDAIILSNLLQVETIFKEGTRNPRLFMGGPDIAGEDVDRDGGSLESLHNMHHTWCGPVEKPNWDMGNFHTAARDTLFWAHHGNIDRLWHLLTSFRGNRPEFRKKDWLDASFVFYDENRELVRCRVADCLDVTKLGYAYQPVPLPWLNARRSYSQRQNKRQDNAGAGTTGKLVDVGEFGTESQILRLPIRVLVARTTPKTGDKESSEVLTIENIVIDEKLVNQHQRFDVFVSKPINGKATTDLGEFAGTFTYIPVHLTNNGKTVLNLGISSVVENLGAGDSENLVVSLIPGIGQVSIGGVKISLMPIDDSNDDDDEDSKVPGSTAISNITSPVCNALGLCGLLP